MIARDDIIKGIKYCDLNGGLIGNCPYKEILVLLKDKEREIEHLKEIIKNTDDALESVKEKLMICVTMILGGR